MGGFSMPEPFDFDDEQPRPRKRRRPEEERPVRIFGWDTVFVIAVLVVIFVLIFLKNNF